MWKTKSWTERTQQGSILCPSGMLDPAAHRWMDPRNKAFLVCSHTEFLWKEMSKCRFSFAEHLLLAALRAVSKNSCWAEQAFGCFCIILGLVLVRCSAAWAHTAAPWASEFGSSVPAFSKSNVLVNWAWSLSILLTYSQFQVFTLLFPSFLSESCRAWEEFKFTKPLPFLLWGLTFSRDISRHLHSHLQLLLEQLVAAFQMLNRPVLLSPRHPFVNFWNFCLKNGLYLHVDGKLPVGKTELGVNYIIGM